MPHLLIFLGLFSLLTCNSFAAEKSHTVLSAGDKVELEFTRENSNKELILQIDGEHFYHLEVSLSKGELFLETDLKTKKDKLSNRVLYKTCFSQVHGTNHERYDLPQDKGQHIGTFTWRPHYSEREVKSSKAVIHLKQSAKLTTPNIGSTGVIRACGVPPGNVSVFSEYDSRYADTTEGIGDRLPNGEVVMWLPSGMWKVRSTPEKDEQAPTEYADCHLVPVHEGKETVLQWPKAMLSASTPSDLGRLEINGAKLTSKKMALVDVGLLGAEKDIPLKNDNVSVFEGGNKASVTEVKPLTSPLSVVLLLDSSGSMKGSMRSAIKATKEFVLSLPKQAKLTIVDFDTKPKVLNGTSKSLLLKSLDTVIARGATALFDSIILGVKNLEAVAKTDRTALVVFTDGVDANWNDTAPGSKASKGQVLSAVKAAQIPVFSIGFGKKPDKNTLGRISRMSGGAYFEASDGKSLEKVFKGISKDLARQYRISYERPKTTTKGDVPVVALMIDNSGSMDHSPDTAGCDFRIEAVRQLFRRFVDALPKEVITQVMTFSSRARIEQVFTSDKSRLKKALAKMKGNGGTNILDAVRTSANVLAAIPSTRRYLCFLSDAALKVDMKDQAELDSLLGSLKDEGVNSLWIGMVKEKDALPFQRAAKLSAGKSIVNEDITSIDKVVSAFLEGVLEPQKKTEGTTLRVAVRQGTKSISAARKVPFSVIVDENQKVNAEEIRHHLGKDVSPYSGELSQLLSGSCIPNKEIIITSRLPVNEERSNKAVALTVKEAVFIDRLRGIEPPRRHRLLAVTTKWRNTLPVQEVAIYKNGANHPSAWVSGASKPESIELRVPTYLIQDLRRHCFLRWNDDNLLPLSEATWLAEEPLILPGERELGVSATKTASGTLLFLVPDEQMNQSSLELFDNNYGHLVVPIAGELPIQKRQELVNLPKSEPAKLSDAFSLTLTGYKDLDAIENVKAEKGMVFRVLSGKFTSRVQALLNFKPAERFRLLLKTHLGELVAPLHPTTALLPKGLFQSTLLAPGSRNDVAFAFRISKLVSKGAKLHGDIRGGGLTVSIDDTPQKPFALPKPSAVKEGLEIFIHKTGVRQRIDNVGRNLIVVEFSLKDLKDSHHTRFADLLVLKPKPGVKKELPNQGTMKKGLGNFGYNKNFKGDRVPHSDATKNLLFGLYDKSVFLDGRTRRGVTLFNIPQGFKADELELTSPIFEDLKVQISDKEYNNPVLLQSKLKKQDFSIGGSEFKRKIAEAAAALINKRRAEGRAKVGAVPSHPLNLESTSPEKESIQPPSLNSLGFQRLQKLIKRSGEESLPSGVDISGIKETLASLQLVTSSRTDWRCRYSPQSVLTQGWASIDDMATLVRHVLSKRGYTTVSGIVRSHKPALEQLAKVARVDKWTDNSLPVITVKKGTEALCHLVVPFMKEVSQIADMVKSDIVDTESDRTHCRCHISVRVVAKKRDSGAKGNVAIAASALSGNTKASKEKTFTLLSETLHQDQIGEGVCDIVYTEVLKNGRRHLFALLGGAAGCKVSEKPVDLSQWEIVREEVRISGNGIDKGEWAWEVGDKEELTNRYRAFAVATPDLPPSAMKAVNTKWQDLHKSAKRPDSLSALRWYTAGAIYRFIGAQTEMEKKLAQKFNVSLNRANKPRVIMVSLNKRASNGQLQATFDLSQVKAQLENGKKEDKKHFRLLSGLFEGYLESWALPNGKGLFYIWNSCPEGTVLLPLEGKHKREAMAQMKKLGYPSRVITGIKKSDSIVLMTSKPATINGRPRWAWISVNPHTFETHTMLDNGAHGSMAEDVVVSMTGNINQCIIGFLKGIETSIWATSSFSLLLADPKEIHKKAKKFCMGLADNFAAGASGKHGDTEWGVGCGIGGLPSADYGIGGITFKDNGKLTLNQNIVTFSSGYKAAVEMYFKDK